MKRNFPYPLLLVTAAVFNSINVLMSQIDPSQSLRSLFVLLLLCIMFLLVIYYWLQDLHRAYFMLFMFILLFAFYPSIYSRFSARFPQEADGLGMVMIPLFGVLYAISISSKVWCWVSKPLKLTYYLNLLCAFLLIYQVIQFGANTYIQITTSTASTAIPSLTTVIQLKGDTRPDIYVLILDAYGREDVLRDIYDYDNSKFTNALRNRGFYVPTNNHSNYVQTTYAMASLWNFDYVQPWVATSDYNHYILNPIQNNRAFELLHNIGYTTVSFEGALSYTQIYNADIYITNSVRLNKFEAYSLVNTPLEPLSNIFNLHLPIPSYESHRQRVLFKFDELQRVPQAIPGPKIVYAHFLVPHPPFVFDAYGNALPQSQPYHLWDDSEEAGGQEAYRQGYREQVKFINGKVLEAVDAILTNSKTPPVILIMGDHGPASMFQFNIDQPGCIWERSSNFYALLLPGHQNDGTLYATITPVNTFRIIFDTYFEANLPLLEDRTYLAAAQYRTKIRDVTNIRDTLAGCTMPNYINIAAR